MPEPGSIRSVTVDMEDMTSYTAPDADTHLALGLSESAGTEPTAWERWIDQVEALLGHDVDGFLVPWEAGRTPAQAVAEIGEVIL